MILLSVIGASFGGSWRAIKNYRMLVIPYEVSVPYRLDSDAVQAIGRRSINEHKPRPAKTALPPARSRGHPSPPCRYYDHGGRQSHIENAAHEVQGDDVNQSGLAIYEERLRETLE